MNANGYLTILVFYVFMSAVAALPTEVERKIMTRGDCWYAFFYRFLQNVCINVRAANPSLSAFALPPQHQSNLTTGSGVRDPLVSSGVPNAGEAPDAGRKVTNT